MNTKGALPQNALQKYVGRVILGTVVVGAPPIALYLAYLSLGLWPTLLGTLVIAVGLFFFLRSGSQPAMKSKYFKLYHIAVNAKSAPDFQATGVQDSSAVDPSAGFLTYAPPRHYTQRGLDGHQIVGIILQRGRGFIPGNLSGNRAFKDKMHAIAAREISDSLRAQAKALGTGQVRLMDDRVQAQSDEAGDEHCIGFYTVQNGEITSYAPNPGFRLFSDQGPLELVEPIRYVLDAEFKNSPPGRLWTVTDKGKITLNDSGFEVMDGKHHRAVVRWPDVNRITAYKRDLFSIDLICLAFSLDETEQIVEIDEEMEGFKSTMELLPTKFDGFDTNWFSKVAHPAFATNLIQLWTR